MLYKRFNQIIVDFFCETKNDVSIKIKLFVAFCWQNKGKCCAALQQQQQNQQKQLSKMKTKQEIFLIYYSYNLRFLQGEFEALCVSHLMWAYAEKIAANNCTHLSACPTCELVYAFCASGGGMNVLICMMCIVNTFQLLYVVVSFSLPLAPLSPLFLSVHANVCLYTFLALILL